MPTAVFNVCDGCKANILEEEVEKHKIVCKHEMVYCVNNCGEKVPRYMQNYHSETECLQKKMKNEVGSNEEVCTVERDGENTAIHEGNVLQITENQEGHGKCYYCSALMSQCELQSHALNCELRLESCEKCEARIQKAYISFHLKDSCVKRIVSCDYCSSNLVAEMLPDHFQVCEMLPVYCENKCGNELQRKQLNDHMSNDCPKRLVTCEHCTNEMKAVCLEDHYSQCLKIPIVCPEACGVNVVRENVEKHKDEECTKLFASCMYEKMLCKYKDFPVGIRDHLKDESSMHMSLMKDTIEKLLDVVQKQEKTINDLQTSIGKQEANLEELQKKVELQCNGFVWKVFDFSHRLKTLKTEECICSPEFYSHKNGYQLQVVLYPNGYDSIESHVSLYVCICSGKYDEYLQWPFGKQIICKLVDQAKQGKDLVMTLNDFSAESSKMPEIDGINEEWGFPKFVSHETLKSGNYICDDSIILEMTVTD